MARILLIFYGANPIPDYSGEFSYWNFSMRIKQWVDSLDVRFMHNSLVEQVTTPSGTTLISSV